MLHVSVHILCIIGIISCISYFFIDGCSTDTGDYSGSEEGMGHCSKHIKESDSNQETSLEEIKRPKAADHDVISDLSKF